MNVEGWFFSWSQCWQIAAMAVVIGLIVRATCRRRPHMAFILWMLVAAKCLVPPLWSSPTGVFSWVERTPATTTTEEHQRRDRIAPRTAATRPPSTRVWSSERPAPEKQHEADGSYGLSAHLGLGWLLGATVLSILVVWRCGRCWRVASRLSRPADTELDTIVRDLSRRLGIRSEVNVRITSSSVGPVLVGFTRPTIFIPEPVLEIRPGRRIELVIAHELIHFRRNDLLSGAVQVVTQVLWWFHPFVWWANRETCRERERCCDEETIAELRCSPAEYARTLIDVLDVKRSLRAISGFPGIRAAEITSKRLEDIMTREHGLHARTPRWCWAVTVAIAAVLLPGAGFDARAGGEVDELALYRSSASHTGYFEGAYAVPEERRGFPSLVVVAVASFRDRRDHHAMVFALDSTGKELWTSRVDSIVWGPALVADGVVYVGSSGGELFAFDVFTGKTLWSAHGPKIGSTPVVWNGSVYVGAYDGTVSAFHAETGRRIWTEDVGGPVSGSPAVNRGRLYVGCQDSRLYILDATTGKKLGEFETGSLIGDSPIVFEDTVVVPSWDGHVYCVDLQGVRRWSVRTGVGFASPGVAPVGGGGGQRQAGVMCTPAVAGGVLYAPATDGACYAWDGRTGRELWATRHGFDCRRSPAVSGGGIFFGSIQSDDPPRLFALNAKDGSLRWSRTAPAVMSSMMSSPAVHAGRVYVGFGDSIRVFGAADGAEFWGRELGGLVGTPTIASARRTEKGAVESQKE